MLGLPVPHHLRTGSRSLFGAGDDVVLRVGGTVAGAQQDLQWADRLRRVGIRVPQAVSAPIEIDDVCVMALERLHPVGQVDWAEVGALVHTVHAMEATADLPRCSGFPHWQFGPLLDDLVPLVDEESAQALRDCHRRHRDWVEQLDRAPTVVLHGDVHPGNVVPTAGGPVLIDWDQRSTGPAAWDHAPLMTWTERWGGSPGLYERFTDGYGSDLRGDALAESLAELRLLAATLMRIAAARHDRSAAAELEVRLQWWRHRPGAPVWTAQ